MRLSRFTASAMTLVMCLATAASIPTRASGHPLHVSYIDLTTNGAAIKLKLRVFTEDFSKHVSGPAGGTRGTLEQRAAVYVASALKVTNRSGASVPLSWCGWRKNGDMMEICLAATIPGGVNGSRMRNTILMDRFADQLNILQGAYSGKSHSLLFTRTSVNKPLT